MPARTGFVASSPPKMMLHAAYALVSGKTAGYTHFIDGRHTELCTNCPPPCQSAQVVRFHRVLHACCTPAWWPPANHDDASCSALQENRAKSPHAGILPLLASLPTVLPHEIACSPICLHPSNQFSMRGTSPHLTMSP